MAKRESFIPFSHVGPGNYVTHDGRFSIVNVEGEGWTLSFSKEHGGEKIASGIASQDDCRKILESRKDRPENEKEEKARLAKERKNSSGTKKSNTRETVLLTAEEFMAQRENNSRQSESAASERNKKKS